MLAGWLGISSSFGGTWFAGSLAFRLWFFICSFLVNANQPFVALPQVVPGASTAFSCEFGTGWTTTANPSGYPTLTLELQRSSRGTVNAFAGRTVQGLEDLLALRGGHFHSHYQPQNDQDWEDAWTHGWTSRFEMGRLDRCSPIYNGPHNRDHVLRPHTPDSTSHQRTSSLLHNQWMMGNCFFKPGFAVNYPQVLSLQSLGFNEET